MHFRTLVTVNIPEVGPDIKTDREIQESIKNIEIAVERCDKDDIGQSVMKKICLSRYKGMSNAFAREVYNAVDELLEPYCESTENPDYLEFEDHTDELKDEYENKSVDCIKLPEGRIVSIHNSIVLGKFTVRNGLVYQKQFGQLKNEKRSKSAKKMTALPNYPYKKLYKGFEDFAEEERYMDYNDKYKGYGYVYNPDAFYDWYCIGGCTSPELPEIFCATPRSASLQPVRPATSRAAASTTAKKRFFVFINVSSTCQRV